MKKELPRLLAPYLPFTCFQIVFLLSSPFGNQVDKYPSASIFAFTTSLLQHWVICAPAASRKSNSRFSGSFFWIKRSFSVTIIALLCLYHNNDSNNSCFHHATRPCTKAGSNDFTMIHRSVLLQVIQMLVNSVCCHTSYRVLSNDFHFVSTVLSHPLRFGNNYEAFLWLDI